MKGKYAARSANAKAATAEATANAVRARMEAEIGERDAQIVALRDERDVLRREIDSLAAQRAADAIASERANHERLRAELEARHADMVRRVVFIIRDRGRLPKSDWYTIGEITGMQAEILHIDDASNRYERRGVKRARHIDDRQRQAGVRFEPRGEQEE